jgi:hypothetical protein
MQQISSIQQDISTEKLLRTKSFWLLEENKKLLETCSVAQNANQLTKLTIIQLYYFLADTFQMVLPASSATNKLPSAVTNTTTGRP